MAEIQDLEVESVETSEIEAVEQQDAEKKQEAAQETSQEEELEPRYRGKTPSEIAKMHREAELLIARQAAEVGEVRKLADELLRSQLHSKPEPEKPKEVDFFENPQEAIRQAVANDPEVLAAKQYAIQARQEQAKMMLVQKHPDFVNVVQDAEFANWIRGSKVRTQLFQQAEAYDVDAADELLSTFKSLKAVKAPQRAVEVDKQARDSALKAASVDTSGSGESSKKVYRRADLIRLKMRDPAKFDAMQDEIDAAYRDGRVK